MNILEELYYGNINPHESGKAYKKLVELIFRNEKELEKSLNKSQKEIFEKFKDCESELFGNYNRDAFIEGFTLGGRIMLEVMKSNSLYSSKEEF